YMQITKTILGEISTRRCRRQHAGPCRIRARLPANSCFVYNHRKKTRAMKIAYHRRRGVLASNGKSCFALEGGG
ncbi:hypothetical protein, partial [Sinorhizobium meliloti]|uniref:hypothetical protein n=1 Tax=Rhizobium meliloti TaxID=382 RepID=UPI001AEC87D7